jgi:hypothetical protein
MAGVMYTIALSGRSPTLSDAANVLNVPEACLDKRFGVVLIDPKKRLYTVLINGPDQPAPSANPAIEGPFSNPGIGHYGPVRSDRQE